jgi:hypothetical protein
VYGRESDGFYEQVSNEAVTHCQIHGRRANGTLSGPIGTLNRKTAQFSATAFLPQDGNVTVRKEDTHTICISENQNKPYNILHCIEPFLKS